MENASASDKQLQRELATLVRTLPGVSFSLLNTSLQVLYKAMSPQALDGPKKVSRIPVKYVRRAHAFLASRRTQMCLLATAASVHQRKCSRMTKP